MFSNEIKNIFTVGNGEKCFLKRVLGLNGKAFAALTKNVKVDHALFFRLVRTHCTTNILQHKV